MLEIQHPHLLLIPERPRHTSLCLLNRLFEVLPPLYYYASLSPSIAVISPMSTYLMILSPFHP